MTDSVLLAASESLPQDTLQQTQTLPMESDCDPGATVRTTSFPLLCLPELARFIGDVPEEFLEPIMLEIMPSAILLFLGQILYLSTLEKSNHSEVTWGHASSNHLKEVAFTPHLKLLPHPYLKAHIDHFLLQHLVGMPLLGCSQTAEAPSFIFLPSCKRKMEPASDNPGEEASCFSTMSLLVSLTTSEHTAKKARGATELELAHMDCSHVQCPRTEVVTQLVDGLVTHH